LFIKKGDNKGNIILPLSRIHLKNQELVLTNMYYSGKTSVFSLLKSCEL